MHRPRKLLSLSLPRTLNRIIHKDSYQLRTALGRDHVLSSSVQHRTHNYLIFSVPRQEEKQKEERKEMEKALVSVPSDVK